MNWNESIEEMELLFMIHLFEPPLFRIKTETRMNVVCDTLLTRWMYNVQLFDLFDSELHVRLYKTSINKTLNISKRTLSK